MKQAADPMVSPRTRLKSAVAPSLRRPGHVVVALLVIVMLVVAVAPGAALAKKRKARGQAGPPGKKRVAIVLPVDAGATGTPLVGKLAKVVKAHGMTAVRGAAVKKVVGTEPPSMDEDWAKVASQLKVDVVIESTMSRSGKNKRLEVVVRSGADGAPAWRESFVAKGPPKKLVAVVGAEFWRKLGSAVRGIRRGEGPAASARVQEVDGSDRAGDRGVATEPPPLEAVAASEPEGKPGGQGQDTANKAASRDTRARADDARAKREEEIDALADDGVDDGAPAGGGEEGADHPSDSPVVEGAATSAAATGAAPEEEAAPPVVEALLDLRFLRRTFSYQPANAAAPYQLQLVPLLGVQGSWFPIRYAGVFARGEFTAGLKSGPYPTVTRELMLGGQGRYPFSRGLVSVSVAAFQHAFRIMDTADRTDAPRSSLSTPNVTYAGVRIGAAARFRLASRFQVGGEGAYRVVTNPGTGLNEVRSAGYFPDAAVSTAFDVGGFVSYRFIQNVEVRVAADFRRYAFGKLTGRVEVDGMVDDYLAVNLGLVGFIGGP